MIASRTASALTICASGGARSGQPALDSSQLHNGLGGPPHDQAASTSICQSPYIARQDHPDRGPGAARMSIPANAVHVCHVLSRWARGGMEMQLARQLQFSNPCVATHSVLSVHSPDPDMPDPPRPTELVDLGGPQTESGVRPASRMRVVDALARELIRREADVVHVRGLWMLRDGWRAARIAGGLPVVFSFHGLDDRTRRAPWWRRFDWQRLLRRCDGVVTVCDALRQELASRFRIDANAIAVIRNGVDTERFQPVRVQADAMRRIGVDAARLNLVCLGSISMVKGYDVLLRAIRELGQARRHVRVLFVGRDCSEGEAQRLAGECGAGADIRFFAETADTLPYLHAAEILISPSRFEGCSNAILEAAACGLPVIATAVGGTPELVRHGESGWLVEPESPRALAAAIAAALAQPTRSTEMGRAARQRACAEFPLRSACSAYEALYAAMPRHAVAAST